MTGMRARASEWEVNIAFDPRDFAIAYIEGDGIPNRYLRLKLLEKNAHLASHTLFEYEELRRAHRTQVSEGEPARQRRRIQYDKECQEITNRATEALEATEIRSESVASQTKSIHANRQDEKALQRASEKFEFAKNTKCSATASESMAVTKVSSTTNMEDAALTRMRDAHSRRH